MMLIESLAYAQLIRPQSSQRLWSLVTMHIEEGLGIKVIWVQTI